MKALSRAAVICLLACVAPAVAHADDAAAPPAPAPAPAPPPVPAVVGAIAPIDRIVAVVNGHPIWHSAVDEELEPMLVSNPTAFRGEIEPKVIAKLIDDALIRDRADAVHMQVDAEEIDRAVTTVMTENHLDAAGLAAALVQNKLSEETFRNELRLQLLDLKTFRVWVATQSVPEPTDAEIDQQIAAMAGLDPKAVDRDNVRALLRDMKMGQMREQWLAGLRRIARIELR